MEKIVEEVLQAEDKAKVLIENARHQAAQLKNNIEQEIAEKQKIAREEAQEIIKNGIQNARDEANREYRKIISDTEEANTSFINKNMDKIDSLVNMVSNLIITPDFYRE